jgi:hypothetical protein
MSIFSAASSLFSNSSHRVVKKPLSFPSRLVGPLVDCDSTSVKGCPLSALSKADPKNLPWMSQSNTLATWQGKTADSLLKFRARKKASLVRGALGQSRSQI